MKAKSAKAKGRALQNHVVESLLSAFPMLEDDDIKGAIMGERGEDIKLSPLAKKKIPFSFECKNVERLQFWSSVEQAEANKRDDAIPVLVVKKNRKEPYISLPLNDFINLIKER
tara:strand:+ start:205 stop:546 length:342 start_codon:yes stop_codon:yes gene_type:complete